MAIPFGTKTQERASRACSGWSAQGREYSVPSTMVEPPYPAPIRATAPSPGVRPDKRTLWVETLFMRLGRSRREEGPQPDMLVTISYQRAAGDA
jgi:hypothetical protein